MSTQAKEHGIHAKETFGIGIMRYLHIYGDIDEYYRELKENSVRFAEEEKNEPYGIEDCSVTDPNEYRFTLVRR